MGSSPFQRLCQFASEIRFETIHPSILSHARLTLIDTLGVIIAGSGSHEISRLIAELVKDAETPQGASCLGRRERASPPVAAMVNGVAGSSLEFEEGNSAAMGHPAIQVVPAIMAICEKRGASGKELLLGVIAGYESAARMGRALSLRKGLHPTGTWGTIGAALGVGRILGRSPEELYEIANIAASFAISPYVKNSFVGRTVADTFAGVVNFFGLLSNTFFDSGIRSDEASLRMTFSRFVSERFDVETLAAGLGSEFLMMQNYFKPYPGCRFAHPAVDAAQTILRGRPLQEADIEKIIVETFQAAMHCGTSNPPTPGAIRFSIPYLLGILVVYGDVTLETLRRVSLGDERVKQVADKLEMRFSQEYEDVRPQHNRSKVTFRLKDGQEISHEAKECWGDPLNPLSEQAICEKFLSNAKPVIRNRWAEDFLERAVRLEEADNIEPLVRLLCSH